MKKTIVKSNKIGGSYSKTTVHGTSAAGLLFVTGQVANKPDTKPSGDPLAQVELGGIEEQTVQVMENVKAILEEAGTDFDHVLKRNVYIHPRFRLRAGVRGDGNVTSAARWRAPA